jgi:Spy/CpxP family protein refolding chaperone
MTRNIAIKFMFVIGSVLLLAPAMIAQENPTDGQPHIDQRPMADRPDDVRNNALAQLGLTPDQVQQIRKLNAERRPVMMEAQKRMRMANRALDEAIYAEQVDENAVHERLREFQLAQAEVAKARFTGELALRKILNPEQLLKFRELRQRFEQAGRRFQNGTQPGGDRPFMQRRRQDRMKRVPGAANNDRIPADQDK